MEPDTAGRVSESRSYQWLGASLSSNEHGRVVICAPRYVTYGPRGTKREPTGDCFVSANKTNDFRRASPCLDDFTNFYRKTYVDPSTDKGFVSIKCEVWTTLYYVTWIT